MATYCDPKDLLLGTDVPLPPDEFLQRYVQDAADEIDSKLGMRYVTPIVIVDAPETRASILLLKRLNAWLASGRLLMAQTAAASDQSVNAYAAMLLKGATDTLEELVSGRFILPGATTLATDDQGRSGPMILNVDADSNVESFYTMTQTPSMPGSFYPPIWPAGSDTPRIPYTW